MSGRWFDADAAWRVAWRSLAPARRGSIAILLALIAAGILLRLHFIGDPANYTFDEELFARNVHHYLLRLADNNDHPPLGKLLMAPGVLLFGYNSVGWRFMSMVFGLQTIVLAYYLAKDLFEDRQAGLFAAAFVAGDGFFIAYARAGLLDGILACFILWSLVAAVSARRPRGVLLAAVLIGLSTSIKWSAFPVVIPAMMAVILLGRVRLWTLGGFALVPLVHGVVWMGGLYWTGQPYRLDRLLGLMAQLYRHHMEMAKHSNPLTSPWYTWPFFTHPITVKLSTHGWSTRYASSVPNLVSAYSSTLAVAVLPCLFALGRAFASVGRRLRLVETEAFPRAVAILLVGWFALLAPWMVARGSYVFIYHYLPSYTLALVLLGGVLSRIARAYPRLALAWVVGLGVVFAFYAPIWGEFATTNAHANWRLFFPSWRPE